MSLEFRFVGLVIVLYPSEVSVHYVQGPVVGSFFTLQIRCYCCISNLDHSSLFTLHASGFMLLKELAESVRKLSSPWPRSHEFRNGSEECHLLVLKRKAPL
jgi:hypothetical protein